MKPPVYALLVVAVLIGTIREVLSTCHVKTVSRANNDDNDPTQTRKTSLLDVCMNHSFQCLTIVQGIWSPNIKIDNDVVFRWYVCDDASHTSHRCAQTSIFYERCDGIDILALIIVARHRKHLPINRCVAERPELTDAVVATSQDLKHQLTHAMA